MNIYHVQPGDTLSKLAIQLIGPDATYMDLMQFNPTITNPDLIQVGQPIYYPGSESVPTETSPSEQDATRAAFSIPSWAIWAAAGLGALAFVLPMAVKKPLKQANPVRKKRGKAARKIARVMREFKQGKLQSHGRKIKQRAQAVAVALRSAGVARK